MGAFRVAVLIAAVYGSIIVMFARSEGDWKVRRIFIHLSILYFIELACLTLLPAYTEHQQKNVNLIPFVGMFLDTPTGYVFRMDFFIGYLGSSFLNALLFLPLGVLFGLNLRHHKVKKAVLITVLACFAVSVLIELLQFWIPGNRASDVDDVIFNTLGGLLGYVAAVRMERSAVFGKLTREIWKDDKWL